MLELIFQGFLEWTYGLILECWEYFSSVLFDLMSLDFAYLETHMPIITTIRQIMLGVGWALLLGNLVFQATRSMMAGVGFEADDPKLLFTRTFVFSFLLVVSPQICDACLNMTSVIIEMVQMPDAATIKLPDESTFVGLAISWLASRVVQTAGKNTTAGKTGAQTQTKPGSKPASGGRYYGGVNTVNTFADSRRSEQQSGSSPRQTEPRASGTEPSAQPASAAADRSFVMPGTRRPVSHVPGEHKIAPSDTAGKAGHTVSRSSHVQAGAQQHTASAAQQHTATSAFESRYSRNTGPARSTVAEKTVRPAPASANTPTKAPRSSTIPQERSAAPSAVSTGQRSGVRPDTAGMSHSTRRPTVSPTRNTRSAPKQTPHIPTPVKQPTVSGRSVPKDAKSSKRAGKKKDDSHAG